MSNKNGIHYKYKNIFDWAKGAFLFDIIISIGDLFKCKRLVLFGWDKMQELAYKYIGDDIYGGHTIKFSTKDIYVYPND